MKKVDKVNLKDIEKTFKIMEPDKSKLGMALINEAVFMQNTLDELKQKIKENGVVTSMCQGSYSIDRANPALNQYNSLIKNYQSCIKQIFELLPKEDLSNEDKFDDDDL